MAELKNILKTGSLDDELYGAIITVPHALPNKPSKAEIAIHVSLNPPVRDMFFLRDVNGKTFLVFWDDTSEDYYFEKLSKAE